MAANNSTHRGTRLSRGRGTAAALVAALLLVHRGRCRPAGHRPLSQQPRPAPGASARPSPRPPPSASHGSWPSFPVGDRIVVGGTFETVIDPAGNEYPARNLAVFSASTGAADLQWAGAANNTVTSWRPTVPARSSSAGPSAP